MKNTIKIYITLLIVLVFSSVTGLGNYALAADNTAASDCVFSKELTVYDTSYQDFSKKLHFSALLRDYDHELFTELEELEENFEESQTSDPEYCFLFNASEYSFAFVKYIQNLQIKVKQKVLMYLYKLFYSYIDLFSYYQVFII